ncbi:MAG: ATP synthase F1 subunit delta [Alphaproteobacteria bacterium]|nr:ATP synthase F1 subunit delta [Alphaproteobacteria bacterium]
MKKISKTKLSAVYAKALYESAAEKGEALKIYEEMNSLREALTADDIKLLSSPIVKTEIKKEIIKELSKKLKLCNVICNALDVIAENGRLGDLKYIFEAFNSKYYEENNIVPIVVKTVKALSSSQDKKLKKKLQELLEKEVLIKYEIRPEILGGLVISYGSYQIDDSIEGKLGRLESVMKGGK